MTCYHPNKVFIVGKKPSGKNNAIFCSATVQFIYANDQYSERWAKRMEECPASVRAGLKKYNEYLYVDDSNPQYPMFYCFDSVEVPCGQCIGCRIDKSKDWANRMSLEASYYDKNCFITLTYDDDNVPRSEYIDCDGGLSESYTLSKRHWQLFMKRLRRHNEILDPVSCEVVPESRIRFYCAGEYGTNTMRPHYHAIIFNYWPDDAELHHCDSRGFGYYYSETLAKLWPYGHHTITKVTWETCAYTARYVTKKLGGQMKGFYDTFNIQPEFSLMSLKPAIGRRFYDDNKDIIYDGIKPRIYLSTPQGGRSFNPPKYYNKLYEVDNPVHSQEIKDNLMKISDNVKKLKLSRTSLCYFDMLAVEEHNFKDKTKSLKRDAI